MAKTVKVAVAWLRKEDWPRWQAIDPELPAYDRWLAKINKMIIEVAGKGVTAEKITVEPEAFVAWCKAGGKPVHRDMRAAYAAAQLMTKTVAN